MFWNLIDRSGILRNIEFRKTDSDIIYQSCKLKRFQFMVSAGWKQQVYIFSVHS